jgi:hypothetical protein
LGNEEKIKTTKLGRIWLIKRSAIGRIMKTDRFNDDEYDQMPMIIMARQKA